MINLKDLSIQELIDLAQESTTENEEVKINDHVNIFIKENGILPGQTLVPSYLIYYNYKRIWRSESRLKITKINFFRNFSKVFEQKRKSKTRYYLLNEDCFDLSEDSLQVAKESDGMYENKKRKKEKLEKPN